MMKTFKNKNMRKQFLLSFLLAVVAMTLFAMPQSARAQTPEAYVIQSGDEKTLTFYYDAQKESRAGTKWGIEEKHMTVPTPAWTGTWQSANTTVTHVVFDASFKNFRPKTTAHWFFKLEALTQIRGIEHLKTSEVTNMGSMFYGCKALNQLDVSGFDTRNVTNMDGMFNECKSLTQLDVTWFNTEKVTNMSRMFNECKSLTQLDVTGFNTEKVTNMSYMFAGCKALSQLDVSKFDTRNVTDMSYMFSDCVSLASLQVTKVAQAKAAGLANGGWHRVPTSFNAANFNTSNVTTMTFMFADCKALTTLDLTSFNTAKVTDMSYMFSGCSSLTTIYSNDAWTCDYTESMFDGCVKLKGVAEYAEGNSNEAMLNPETGYFTKKSTTGIVQTGHAATVKAVYSVDGRRLKEPQTGVNIVKMSDGTTRKVVKR